MVYSKPDECQLCNKCICRGKVLECDHAFCTTCLQKYYVHSNQLDIPCPAPLCHRVTMLPTGIIGDLEDYRDPQSVDGTTGGGQAGVSPHTPAAVSPARPDLPPTMVTRPRLMRSWSEQPAVKNPKKMVRQQSILNEKQQEALRRKMNNMATRSISLPAPSTESMTSLSSNGSRRLVRQSTLTTEDQLEALRRKMEREPSLLQPKVVTPPIPEEPKKCTGFTTRKSKPKMDPEPTGRGRRAILGGGLGFLMNAGRASEMEFRGLREGPWGYDSIHEWGGREWGMVTH